MPNLNPNGRLVVPYLAGDQGTGRPLPEGSVIWESPNIRLLTYEESKPFMTSSHWDTSEAGTWNGKVFVGEPYYLLVRVFNRGDFATEPHGPQVPLGRIRMEGWVSNFAAGAIGPSTVIKTSADPDNDGTPAFQGFNAGVVQPGESIVVRSNGFWKPQAGDIGDYNDGHVCVGVNVYSEGGTIGGAGLDVQVLDADATYEADGKALLDPPMSDRLDLLANTHHGQRNIMITPKPLRETLVRKVLVEVPAYDRCPLEAEVALRAVELAQGSAELAGIAATAGLSHHHCPTDSLENVSIDDCGDPSHEVGIFLKPGEQKWLTITVEPGEDEMPGDIYAFDIITTEEANNKVYGAARMYVVVTA
ncbi:hypothetical protein [Nocardia sp. CA-120079]|uniref:hypothetical protein n=1 Tax=Nocardia sp. CA-120079 TaxID=3239974 RepID=UPI003D9A06B7